MPGRDFRAAMAMCLARLSLVLWDPEPSISFTVAIDCGK
jgi:hypothetical protein